MVSVQELSVRWQLADPEERHIISGVSWEQYEELLAEMGDRPIYRITYLDGILELMSPSRRHESKKTYTGSLLEDYFKEKRIRYFAFGSTTLRKKLKQSGVEPDEAYCFGVDKEFPDLAIEVIETSGSINKLEVYRRLEIPEVWFLNKKNRFQVYHLREDGYEQIERSEVLSDLDLDLLAKYAISAKRNSEGTADDPLEAALEFRAQIRQS